MTSHESASPLNRKYLIALIIVLINATVIGIRGIFNYNFIEILLNKFLTINNTNMIIRIIYVIVGICAIYLIFFTSFHTFLPFLDKTVLPPSVLLLSEQANTNTQITINAHNATKVVYWAAHADENNIEDNPIDAYDKYDNVGIAAVNNHKAILKLKCPTKYQVGKKILPKHLHYRLIYANGVLSKVFTLKLENQCKSKSLNLNTNLNTNLNKSMNLNNMNEKLY